MLYGCITSMTLDSPLLPPKQHSHQVLINSMPTHGRLADF
jgi:hypothetical protein